MVGLPEIKVKCQLKRINNPQFTEIIRSQCLCKRQTPNSVYHMRIMPSTPHMYSSHSTSYWGADVFNDVKFTAQSLTFSLYTTFQVHVPVIYALPSLLHYQWLDSFYQGWGRQGHAITFANPRTNTKFLFRVWKYGLMFPWLKWLISWLNCYRYYFNLLGLKTLISEFLEFHVVELRSFVLLGVGGSSVG